MELGESPIFFDISRKRWGYVKIALVAFLLIALLALTSVFYAYSYGSSESKDLSIDAKIEEINNKNIPAQGNGTFIEMSERNDESFLRKLDTDEKIVVLSFDDGPDPKYTPQILGILEKENIHASFFVTGNMLYKHKDVADKIYEQGSDIGMHTFSHTENLKDEKISSWTFLFEMDFTDKIFAHNYGYKTKLFRVPFLGNETHLSYDALQYIGEAHKRHMVVSAPTMDSFDWREKDVDTIVKNSTENAPSNSIILFHDSGGDRTPTIKALPEIIEYYKSRGYKFVTISEFAKTFGYTTQSELTTTDKIMAATVYNAYDAYQKSSNVVSKGLVLGFAFAIIHILLFLTLAFIQIILTKFGWLAKRKDFNGLISIIIPMYNEEKAITPAISSLLVSDKKNLEVIIVDDGCTDMSFEKVSTFLNDKRVKIVTQRNYGKYKALNRGIEEAKGEITVLIDADTRVLPDSIDKIASYFADQKVGGVAGNIIVGNANKTLTRLQDIEYTSMQAIDKRVYDLFGSVNVVPGAFGAFRTHLIKKFGGFSYKTLAEDFDLTMGIISMGYKVRFAPDAVAFTEAPGNIKALLNQRLRWSFGNLQVLYKNKNMLFNIRYGVLGLFLLPRSVFIQIPSMLLLPLIDAIAIAGFLANPELTAAFVLAYFILQLSVNNIAFIISGRKFENPELTLLMRLPYTHLMFASLAYALFTAIQGRLLRWTKINHIGNISLPGSVYNAHS